MRRSAPEGSSTERGADRGGLWLAAMRVSCEVAEAGLGLGMRLGRQHEVVGAARVAAGVGEAQKRSEPRPHGAIWARKDDPALTYFRLTTIIGPVCLTAVFGMGTGISRRVWAPGSACRRRAGRRACGQAGCAGGKSGCERDS